MTTRHADYFWIATLVVLAAVNLALYLHPENLSFSSRVAYWLTHYRWLPTAYVIGAIWLYFHFWK